MKKFISILLCAAITLSLASCGTPKEVYVADSAVDLFSTVWSSYSEEELFPVYGGDFSEENSVEGAPGVYSLADPEAVYSDFGLPTDITSMVDDCASLKNMFNVNTFTGVVFHVTDTANVQTVCDKIKDDITARHWMCGWPDVLVVMTAGNYVISAFGNLDLITNLRDKTLAAYEDATEVYWESLVE